MVPSLRLICNQTLATSITHFPLHSPTPINPFSPRLLCCHQASSALSIQPQHHNPTPIPNLLGFINGKTRVIEIAHSFWRQILHKGDTVVDATCGNGHDTLALLNMVSDLHNPNPAAATARVYALDIQKCAIDNTTSLLHSSLPSSAKMRDVVQLFQVCHTKMEDIVPQHAFVRLVVFNLGYLPGGDKSIVTVPDRTLEALKAASRVVGSGGVISVMLYVGHPGGREEYETVLAFAASLAVDTWVCSKFEMVNRPLAPVLVFIFKK